MAYVFLLFVFLYLARCEVMVAPVQIQRIPYEDTVVLYCKTIGVHLLWEFNGLTLAVFDGDEEVGAVKQRTQRGNTIATAILLSRALNSDNITVRTSVLILNKKLIEDRPIRADCLGGGMDQASYIVTDSIGDNSHQTESTSSEATTISLDDSTSTCAPDFPTLGFEVASAPSMGVSLVPHLVVSSLIVNLIISYS